MSETAGVWVAALVTCVLAGVLTPVLGRWARQRNYLDIPNDRSSHTTATPRIGGVALVLGVVAGVASLHLLGLRIQGHTLVVFAAGLGIAALGLVDDFRHLPAVGRLVIQVAFASGAVLAAGPAPLPLLSAGGPVAVVLSVLWIVTLTNAYNFMDGIDGLAGVQAIVGGAGWVLVGMFMRVHDATALGALLAAAGAGFLLHNWPPATVFMGDAGSGFLGFLFGAIPVLAPAGRTSAWWCAVLLMWPFLFDTGFTLLRRARRGENLLAAHRSHLYQRLVRTGLSHRHVTLLYGELALLGLFSALATQTSRALVPLVAGTALVIAAGALWWGVTARETGSGSPPQKTD